MKKICPLLASFSGTPYECHGNECYGNECMFSKEKVYFSIDKEKTIVQECLMVKALEKYTYESRKV